MSDQDSQIQALGILIEGVKKAFAQGVYTFEESGQLYNAVGTFLKRENTVNDNIQTSTDSSLSVTAEDHSAEMNEFIPTASHDTQTRKRGRPRKSDE